MVRSFKALLSQIVDHPHIKDVLIFNKDGPINIRVDKDNQKWITTNQLLYLEGLIQVIEHGHPSAPDELENLRADIRGLHQLSKFKHQFSQFRNLPPEIRVMIWGYATPPKFVEVRSNRLVHLGADGTLNATPDGRSVPPVTAQVCRESRAVACRHGRLVPIIKPRLRSQPNSEASDPDFSDEISQSDLEASEFESIDEISQSDFGNNESQFKPLRTHNWGWFDPSRDSLVISWFSDTPEIVAKDTQHITLNSPVVGYISASFFPRLKYIDCVECMHIQPQYLDPILEARLFGCNLDNFLIIDVNDIDALIQKVGKDYSSYHFDRLRRMRSEISDTCIRQAMRSYHDGKLSCPAFRRVAQILLRRPSNFDIDSMGFMDC